MIIIIIMMIIVTTILTTVMAGWVLYTEVCPTLIQVTEDTGVESVTCIDTATGGNTRYRHVVTRVSAHLALHGQQRVLALVAEPGHVRLEDDGGQVCNRGIAARNSRWGV